MPQTSRDYDLTDAGARLDSRRILANLPEDDRDLVVRLLPIHLLDQEERSKEAGWCMASVPFLNQLWHDSKLTIDRFRKATLANGDTMSSTADLSQPVSDNCWALVPYIQSQHGRESAYMCVVQVQFYARVTAGTDEYSGFSLADCRRAGIELPLNEDGLVRRHEPVRVAVCKMWLAQGCTEAMGAIGCRAEYCLETQRPPDMVIVTNPSESSRVIKGQQWEVLKQAHRRRYYGFYLVDINDLRCQVVPTAASEHGRCFLVCDKMSGK